MKIILRLVILFITLNHATVFAQVAAPVISGTSTSICPGESIVLTASGCSGTVRWSIGTSGTTVAVSAAGSYAARCETISDNSPFSAPYVLQSNTNFSGTITLSGIDCANNAAQLSATNLPSGAYPQYYKDGVPMYRVNTLNYKVAEAGTYTYRAVKKILTISNNYAINTSQNINDIFYINANKGWAVGDGGLILTTNDGGQNWSNISMSITPTLKDVFFINEQTGWASGLWGALFKTTDGGTTWTFQSVSGVSGYDHINAVFFTDSNNGWVASSNKYYYRTTNGGNTWSWAGGGGSSEMIDIYFIGQYTGWLLKDDFLQRTTDGGASWQSVYLEYNVSENNHDVFFLNAYEGWLVGDNGYIAHTSDGGATWKAQLSDTHRRLNKVMFTSAKDGVIVGEKGLMLYTSDGGNTWIRKETGLSEDISGLFFTGANTAWISGANGVLRKITTSSTAYCATPAVVIRQNPLPPQVVKSACNSMSVILKATGCTGLVSWKTGATGTTLTVLSSGTYTASCTINGCKSVDSRPEIVDLGPSGNLTAENGNNCLSSEPRLYVSGLSGGYSYEWRKNSIPFDNGNNTDFRPTETGTYDVVPYTKGEKIWEWQSPEVPTFAMHATAMSAPGKAWAVGQRGYIMYTEDGGKSWRYILIDAAMEFHDIQFVNEQTGFAVGIKSQSNYIVKTTDGGRTWQKFQMNNHPQPLQKLFFLDENTGWAVGAVRTIMKTTNGGLNWYFQSQDYYSQEHLNSVFFANSNDGWATGIRGTILRTSDGGNSWYNQTSPDIFTHFHDVAFMNNQKGVIVGEDGALLRTADGGQTWKLDSAMRRKFTGDYYRIQFINENTGWIFGAQCILNTIDGGATWGIVRNNINPSYKLGGAFFDYQHGIMAGSGGTMIVTHDGGFSWSDFLPAAYERFKEVSFTDNYNGKVLGDSKIGITNNGGRTWTYHTPSPVIGDLFQDFHFIDNNRGWMITSKKVYYSGDGGISWAEQYAHNGSPSFTSIFFTDENNGWITGNAELLLKTTNGGNSWTVVTLPTRNVTLNDIHFIGNKGWLIGEQGRLYYSDNAGTTWTLQENLTSSDLYDVFFIDENTGWIGTTTEVYRTTNGGVSWQRISYYSFDVSKVHFASPNKGWALMGNGQLFTSYDGGISWNREEVSPHRNSGIFALNEEAVMIVGHTEGIQKFYNKPTYYCPTNSVVISNPGPPTLSSFTRILCQNKTITLTAADCEGTINWSNGSTGSSIIINTAGTYTARCISNNCVSNISQPVLVTASANCSAVTIAPGSVYACPNKPLNLAATGCPGDNVIWSNNMTGSAIQINLTTATTIEAFCQSGGSQTAEIKIAVDDLNLITNMQGGEHQIQANKSIESSSRISNGGTVAKVDYRSGKSILLKPGFEVSQQNTFKAEIKSCQN